MNDIATASDRGRRTLYTYFRTKSDIYQAVIEAEADRIRAAIEETVEAQATPAEKLRALIISRSSLASADSQHGSLIWLRSLFSSDVKRAAMVRSLVAKRIYVMIHRIINEGIKSGDFVADQARRLPAMLTMLARGADWSATYDDNSPAQFERRKNECVDFIIEAISTPRTNEQ